MRTLVVLTFACLSAHTLISRGDSNSNSNSNLNSTSSKEVNCNDYRNNKCQPTTPTSEKSLTPNETLLANGTIDVNVKVNVTCCFPYKLEFNECYKWKLDSSEFEIVQNQLVEKSWPNNRNLALGEYRRNSDDSVYVCVPLVLGSFAAALQLDLLFFVLCIASTVTVSTCLVSYVICPFRRHDSKSLICHMSALVGLHVVRLSFQMVDAVTYRVYFCTLFELFSFAANSWLNVISYDVWTKFDKVAKKATVARLDADGGECAWLCCRVQKACRKPRTSSESSYFWLCFCYAWGVACLLLAVEFALMSAGVVNKPLLIMPGIYGFNWSSMYFFVCVTVMQCANVVSFVLTCSNIRRMRMRTETAKDYVEVNEKIILQYKQLFLVISIIYTLVCLQRIPVHKGMAIALDFLLVMQGFYFFLVYGTNDLNLIFRQCCHKLVN